MSQTNISVNSLVETSMQEDEIFYIDNTSNHNSHHQELLNNSDSEITNVSIVSEHDNSNLLQQQLEREHPPKRSSFERNDTNRASSKSAIVETNSKKENENFNRQGKFSQSVRVSSTKNDAPTRRQSKGSKYGSSGRFWGGGIFKYTCSFSYAHTSMGKYAKRRIMQKIYGSPEILKL